MTKLRIVDMKRVAAPTLMLAALLSPLTASAQTEGFALNRFNPADHGSDFFSLDSLDLQGNGRLSLGVLGDYAHKPLVIYDAAGDEFRSPVKDQFYLHVGGTVILRNRFRLSANLPLLLV